MLEKKLKVNLQYGLHARPSSHIVTKLAPLKIDHGAILCKGNTADLKSILSLLTLFAGPGDEVTVQLSGPDELQAMSIIEDILNEKDNEEIYN